MRQQHLKTPAVNLLCVNIITLIPIINNNKWYLNIISIFQMNK